MITRHNIIVLGICAVIAAAIPVLAFWKRPAPALQYRTFREAGGWGYDIILGDRTIIHQEDIPAIAEKKEFPSEKEASEVAQCVVLKLKNNKLPTLSKNEVEQICTEFANRH